MNNLKQLRSDIQLYHIIPNSDDFIEHRKVSYIDYPGLLETIIMSNIDIKSVDIMIKRIRNDIELKKPVQTLLNIFGKKYEIIINYIYDSIKNERKNKKYTNIQIDDDKNKDIQSFEWRKPQEEAWKSAINNNFNNGIFSIATGVGKSLIILKIFWEYHKRHNKDNLLFFCERKDILQKLFYVSYKNKKAILNEDNIILWKKNDIIDLNRFEIMEFVYTKDKNWVNKINNYKGDKPLFIVINRQFLTTYSSNLQPNTFKYQNIAFNEPKLIVLDECHSGLANRTYEFLTHAKNNWKSKIHGFSATPYRAGKNWTKLKLVPELEYINDELNHDTNVDRITNIFHKTSNSKSLNILYSYNLKDAIENGYILEPVFNWFQIDKYKKKEKNSIQFTDTEIVSVLGVLDDILGKCYYKKTIVWCREKNIVDKWHQLFEKYKYSYGNLQNLDVYKSYSGPGKSDYDDYYNKLNGIMFCACQYREGSDIPYLSCELLLDKTFNRNDLVSIQYFGRVLRLDPNNKKDKGYIIDGCLFDDDKNKIRSIIDKIIRYYLNLYDIVVTEELYTKKNELNEDKLMLYDKIVKSLEVEPDKKEIHINLNNNKKMTINVDNFELTSIEWNKIIPHFGELLKTELIMSEYEEFITFRDRVRSNKIQNKNGYLKKYKSLNFCKINAKNEKIYIKDPSITYETYFRNWYDFLNINTDNFIPTKSEWKKVCLSYGLNQYNYNNQVECYPQLPDMPGEFYNDFTNLYNELKTESDDDYEYII
jgi:superfamily II DNA or RNA helicase